MTVTTKSFKAASPAVKFTSDDITFLKVNFSGTPTEIADSIKRWQEDNWTYASSVMDYQDVSDPIRWNYFLPGVFTSADIVREHVKDGKIYGICFDYAVVYCSIAEYYGLEARVVNSISKPSDANPGTGPTRGMAYEEYERLKIKLDKLGIKYDFAAVRLVAEETPTHYWAEVKIDGQWVIKDATQKATGNDTKTDFVNTNDYQVTDWLSRDRSTELNDYQQRLANGEKLPEPVSDEDAATTKPKDYKGMTDDLGQTGRAAIIDDLIKGWALAPYFNNVKDAYTYIKAEGISQENITKQQNLKQMYETLSSKKMYSVALLMCQDLRGNELAAMYNKLCGVELDLQVLEQMQNQFGGQ